MEHARVGRARGWDVMESHRQAVCAQESTNMWYNHGENLRKDTVALMIANEKKGASSSSSA